MAQRDASDLIAFAADGDELALRRIIADHHEDMRRVCSYVLGESAVVDSRSTRAEATTDGPCPTPAGRG